MVEIAAFYIIKAELHHMIRDASINFFCMNTFVRQDGRNKCFLHSLTIQFGIPENSRGKGFKLHVTNGVQIRGFQL